MRIFVAGTRGIPDIPGGVEKHCEELYPRLAAFGHEVFLSTRSPYVKEKLDQWGNVKLINCYAPKMKSAEAIVHTFLSILKAYRLRVDIIHIHAVGPALLVPFARFLGLKVVFTNHGPDYDRQKWGRLAKMVLRLGELLGCLFANKVISISNTISGDLQYKYAVHPVLIPNGVTCQSLSNDTDFLARHGIIVGKYILSVARFVPEKGLDVLIDAFIRLDSDFQLVISGDADHESDYSLKIKEMAAANRNIILTGYITGEDLRQVFSHAALFVLPSYHEGLPIALLEAMSYGRQIVVSDISAHIEMNLPQECYFKCGDANDLTVRLKSVLSAGYYCDIALESGSGNRINNQMIFLVKNKYDWNDVASKTMSVYAKI